MYCTFVTFFTNLESHSSFQQVCTTFHFCLWAFYKCLVCKVSMFIVLVCVNRCWCVCVFIYVCVSVVFFDVCQGIIVLGYKCWNFYKIQNFSLSQEFYRLRSRYKVIHFLMFCTTTTFLCVCETKWKFQKIIILLPVVE